MSKRIVSALIPVEVDCDPVGGVAEEVLWGTYEAGFYGHHLTILDIGANIGGFALWANLRWPQSRIFCYEPNPVTFRKLLQNVAPLDNVTSSNVAVYSCKLPLYAHRVEDGEAALLVHAQRFFKSIDQASLVDVAVVHPSALPKADIVKVDTEGSEVEILKNLDLSETSLILLEYHTMADRSEICRLLSGFSLEYEHRSAWANILRGSDYRPELSDDYYGVLVFHRPGSERVWKDRIPEPPPPGLRRLLRALPAALRTSLLSRLRR